jgi:hypothetical protein
MIRVLFILGFALFCLAHMKQHAGAHSWYSGKKDPVFKQSCCGGTDCATWLIQPGEYSLEATGVRVRLTLERTRTINKYSTAPIDALVDYTRIQPSEDGNFHLCVMTTHRDNERAGIYCLFAPPNI